MAVFKNSALAKVCSLTLKFSVSVLELMHGFFLEQQHVRSP
jgi:hypothetical protein